MTPTGACSKRLGHQFFLFLLCLCQAPLVEANQQDDSNETEAIYIPPYNRVGGILVHESNNTENPIKLGLINGGSAFFEPVLDGWRATCEQLDITCYAAQYDKTLPTEQGMPTDEGNCAFKALTSMKWVEEHQIHGIAMTPCEDNPFLENLTAANVPVVLFDGDDENRKQHRIAYVGTDQSAMGRVMGRLLRQQRPEGGTFAITLGKEGRTEGFMEEIMKDNDRDDRAHWYPVEGSDASVEGWLFANYSWEEKYAKRMEFFAERNATAIVTFRQTPMRIPMWKEIVDKYRDLNITYLGVDASPFQLDYLNQKYVDGLVGQSPWMMGKTLVDVLTKYIRHGKVDRDFYPTNLIAYNMIPVELPELELDKNLLGPLSWLGISCFIVVGVSALYCIGWTLYYQRSSLVVGAAQPFFLVMIAVGVLTMSAALVPLSFDDDGEIDSLSDREKAVRCMTIPWLSFTGFSVGTLWRYNGMARGMVIKLVIRMVLTAFRIVFLSNALFRILQSSALCSPRRTASTKSWRARQILPACKWR